MKQAAAVVWCLVVVSCTLVKPRPTPPLKGNPFPVEETWSLTLPGRVQFALSGPDARIFLVLEGGDLLCLDPAGQTIQWTYKAGSSVELAPSLGERGAFLCDRDNILHAVGFDGTLLYRKPIGEEVTSPPVENGGRIYLVTGGGTILALDAGNSGEPLWAYPIEATVRSAPVFLDDRIFFGDENGTLICLGRDGRPIWSFKGRGKILISPAVSGRRIVFGTEEHLLYCLSAARGRKKWSFDLGGGPVRPPQIPGKRIVFAASNSVVYCLSGRRGEILWWKSLPSRILYDPVLIGEVVLVSSASSEIRALELKSGNDAGGVDVAGEVSTGVMWIPPVLVVIARDPDGLVDRVISFKSKPTAPDVERTAGKT